MLDALTARDQILDSLVEAVGAYERLSEDQCKRFNAFRVECTRLDEGLASEFKAFDDELKLINDFLETADNFPKTAFDETLTVIDKQVVRKSWFSWPRTEEILKEVTSPSSTEAKVQNARLHHLVGLMADHISARRTALGDCEFNLKKFVVNLNDAERISIDDCSRKKITRDRYMAEQLVSSVEARRQELVIIGRKVLMLYERLETSKSDNLTQEEVA